MRRSHFAAAFASALIVVACAFLLAETHPGVGGAADVAAPWTPPKLCASVCTLADAQKDLTPVQLAADPATEKEVENIRAACYSCRCGQIVGRPVSIEKASDLPVARTFTLDVSKKPFHVDDLPADPPYPTACVNPALLGAVDSGEACATGNRLGQDRWEVKEGSKTLRVYAKSIFRKKGSLDRKVGDETHGIYDDWGKIYYREDGFTCNFDDIDPSDGRDGDIIGEPRVGGFDTRGFPALDLTWVVTFWEDKAGLTDAERVKKIANDPDITAWRSVFHVITGEDPGSCSECHTAGPFLYTPLLSRLHKGTDAVAWQSIAPRLLAPTRFVYPAFNGARLQVRSRDGAAMILDTAKPLKDEAAVKAFKTRFAERSKALTGAVRETGVTLDDQSKVTTCMPCHFAGKGPANAVDEQFWLRRLAINSSGTIHHATDDPPDYERPYQADFKKLVLLEPQNADVFPWAMWMPGAFRHVNTLKDWWDKYLESRVLLELCRERVDAAPCRFIPASDASGPPLPAF
jgi:hypothetical protein